MSENKTVVNLYIKKDYPIVEMEFRNGFPTISGPYVTKAAVTRNAALNGYAEAMQKRLDENESKGGWEQLSEIELVRRINTNLNSLIKPQEGTTFDELEKQAADAGNYCMMLFDNLKRFRDKGAILPDGPGTDNVGPGN